MSFLMKISQGKISSILLRTEYKKTLISYIRAYRVKLLSDQKYINLHFLFTQSYENYGNIALGTTCKTNLKKIYAYQKKVAELSRPFLADCPGHAKPVMQNMNGINACQIAINQNLILLFKVHTGSAPSIFLSNYLTSSQNNSRMRIAQVYACVLFHFLLKVAAFDVPFQLSKWR